MLTPIQRDPATKILVKRDDLFRPFGAQHVNGGKVRQFGRLLKANQALIRKRHHNTVVVQSSIFSSTVSVLAEVANHFGMQSVVCVGGTRVDLYPKHRPLTYALAQGCDVRNVCGTGMSGPIMARLREIVAEEQFFDACLKHNVEQPCVLNCIAKEVQNLPEQMDLLVIPSGSGIHAAAIMLGLQKHQKQVKRIVAIGVGPNRSDDINEWLKLRQVDLPEYEFVSLKTVYAKGVKATACGALLDPLYEAKAWNYMLESLSPTKRSVFWNAGVNISAFT